MQTLTKPTYKYWQDGEFWVGYLETYPDYMTQGSSLDDLKENLSELYKDLSSGKIPSSRKVGELDIS